MQLTFDKIRTFPLQRYYILTTSDPNVAPGDADSVAALLRQIRQTHGCELIVNGLMPSLRYYLRLVPEPSAFLNGYTRALEADFATGTDLKRTHLEKWHKLLEQGGVAKTRNVGITEAASDA